jgi:hypothetical protein
LSARRWPRFVALSLAAASALAVGCGDGTGPPTPVRVTVSPEIVIVDQIGRATQFTARAEDADGATVSGVSVAWSSSDPAIATIDRASGLASARSIGTTTILAAVAGVTGEATLEVFVPSGPDFVAGETYFGLQRHTEYQAGDLPVIVSAPHGGNLEPDQIPLRTYGVTTQDRQTQELIRALAAALFGRSSGRPHVIINRLHRNRLDANREIEEAAQESVYAEWAWAEYHGFIDAAKQLVVEQYGRGLYLDIHGHGHDIQRSELGYLLRTSDLELPDNLLDDPELINRSSIRRLALDAAAGFVELVRGPTSLGGLLAQQGFPSVPSPDQPDPGGAPYFTGGYNTVRHGSRDGGMISGIQIEVHRIGARDSASSRAAFADALTLALETYMAMHFQIDLSAASTADGGESITDVP